MLVDRQERTGELAVLEQTIHITIEPMEEQVAVLLCCRYIQSAKSDVKLLRIQVPLTVFVQDSKGIDHIEVIAQG